MNFLHEIVVKKQLLYFTNQNTGKLKSEDRRFNHNTMIIYGQRR